MHLYFFAVKKLNYVAMDVGGGVKMCDACDPYAVVLLVDGTLGLLELKERQEGEECEEEAYLKLHWPDIEKAIITCLCVCVCFQNVYNIHIHICTCMFVKSVCM